MRWQILKVYALRNLDLLARVCHPAWSKTNKMRFSFEAPTSLAK